MQGAAQQVQIITPLYPIAHSKRRLKATFAQHRETGNLPPCHPHRLRAEGKNVPLTSFGVIHVGLHRRLGGEGGWQRGQRPLCIKNKTHPRGISAHVVEISPRGMYTPHRPPMRPSEIRFDRSSAGRPGADAQHAPSAPFDQRESGASAHPQRGIPKGEAPLGSVLGSTFCR